MSTTRATLGSSMPSASSPVAGHPLLDPRFRDALARMVRRRVPESEAEDIVQSALTEALAAGKREEEADAVRRWVWGVVRHKVVDYYRQRRRMAPEELEVAAPEVPHDELDLLRWARRELPPGKDAEETLRWMLREADGEKLETIAEESNVPAPRVRKRVSRLREHFRSRWAGQAAALVALGILAVIVLWIAWPRPSRHDDIVRDRPRIPSDEPHELAEEKRREAFERCEEKSFAPCLKLLDEARQMDPAGDSTPVVQRARKAAQDALDQERQAPAPAPSNLRLPPSSPSPSALPVPTTPTPEGYEPRPNKMQGPTKGPAKPAPPGKMKPSSDSLGGSSEGPPPSKKNDFLPGSTK